VCPFYVGHVMKGLHEGSVQVRSDNWARTRN
jgi:hypothetical protein